MNESISFDTSLHISSKFQLDFPNYHKLPRMKAPIFFIIRVQPGISKTFTPKPQKTYFWDPVFTTRTSTVLVSASFSIASGCMSPLLIPLIPSSNPRLFFFSFRNKKQKTTLRSYPNHHPQLF